LRKKYLNLIQKLSKIIQVGAVADIYMACILYLCNKLDPLSTTHALYIYIYIYFMDLVCFQSFMRASLCSVCDQMIEHFGA